MVFSLYIDIVFCNTTDIINLDIHPILCNTSNTLLYPFIPISKYSASILISGSAFIFSANKYISVPFIL